MDESSFSILVWLFGFIDNHFPWLALIVVWVFSNSLRTAVRSILLRLGSAQNVKLAGMEFDMTTREFARVETAYNQKIRTALLGIFDPMIQDHKLVSKFAQFVDDEVTSLMDRAIVSQETPDLLRCAVHVISPHDEEQIYQLIEFYPPSEPGKIKRGRMKSIRFGIIGRALRGNVTTYSGDINSNKYVSDWGMTPAEAEAVNRGNSTYLAIPIENELKQAIGVVSIDVGPKFAFGLDVSCEQLDERLRGSTGWAELSDSVAGIHMRARSEWAEYQTKS